MPRSAVTAICLLIGLAGCRAIDFYEEPLEEALPEAAEPPRELSMMSLPSYRIEPPDVLQIEILKLVPRPPYRAEVYDVLQIQVVGTLLDQPIAGFYLVEGEGTVNLGPTYGTVRVVGMTIEEIQEAIGEHLLQFLREPVVSVQLARAAGVQEITGPYLVGPDGTINLRNYGEVHVAGKTVDEAQVIVEKQLAHFFDSPEVAISVIGYNSKKYFVITEGPGVGDSVVPVPITGNETVLDAISNVGGLSQLSSKRIWVARPAPGGQGCDQILPVDWVAITRGASTATNYQLLPDDRVFIAGDDTLLLTNVISKLAAPFERVAGIASLGASTIRTLQTMGRSFNRFRRI